MDFELYTPQRLSGLVKNIWLVTSEATVNYQLLPESGVNLVFNLTPSFQGLEGRLIRNGCSATRDFCFLSGMQEKPIIFSSTHFQQIAVELHPMAVNTLFRIPCSELKNDVVEGSMILGDLNKIQDTLLGPGAFIEKAKWLEDYLYSKINESSEWVVAQKMNATISKMYEDLLAGKKVNIQERTGYSRMHTHRLSTEWLGLPPKGYLRLQQFIKTLDDLHFSSRSFADIAIHHGYYDQTHFNRIFRQFTDMTPTDYQQRKSSFVGQLSS